MNGRNGDTMRTRMPRRRITSGTGIRGSRADYPGNLEGGYLNNGSTGFTPRFSEENVRQMFTSSAAALLDDFHIDGLRVDLTDAIHQNNTLNADGSSVGSANLYESNFCGNWPEP